MNRKRDQRDNTLQANISFLSMAAPQLTDIGGLTTPAATLDATDDVLPFDGNPGSMDTTDDTSNSNSMDTADNASPSDDDSSSMDTTNDAASSSNGHPSSMGATCQEYYQNSALFSQFLQIHVLH